MLKLGFDLPPIVALGAGILILLFPRLLNILVALYLILAMSMFPGISILGSLYTVLQRFHLYNTLYALIIVYLTFSLPLMVWIMQSFFRGMPRDLEEAAYVDGASQFQTFWRIMIPLAAPGLGQHPKTPGMDPDGGKT